MMSVGSELQAVIACKEFFRSGLDLDFNQVLEMHPFLKLHEHEHV